MAAGLKRAAKAARATRRSPKDAIKEYQIATAASASELQEWVNQLIVEGWQPLGGAFSYAVKEGEAATSLGQAMVK